MTRRRGEEEEEEAEEAKEKEEKEEALKKQNLHTGVRKNSAGCPRIPQHDSCSYRSFALPVARPPLPSTTPRRHTITVPRSPRFALPPSLRPTLCQRIHLSIDCWAPIRMHTHGRPPNTHTLSLSLSPTLLSAPQYLLAEQHPYQAWTSNHTAVRPTLACTRTVLDARGVSHGAEFTQCSVYPPSS